MAKLITRADKIKALKEEIAALEAEEVWIINKPFIVRFSGTTVVQAVDEMAVPDLVREHLDDIDLQGDIEMTVRELKRKRDLPVQWSEGDIPWSFDGDNIKTVYDLLKGTKAKK